MLTMAQINIRLPENKIKAFCQKWQITEFAVFGSAIRGDFRPDSDVDVLVTFESTARWTLFDHVDMETELKAIWGRDGDLVSRRGIERSQNHIRRRDILDSAQVIYAVA